MQVPIPERFEVLEELSRTPEETLLRARDRTLQREVVLKAPGPDVADRLRQKGDRALALREARALARLQHPGVARLLEVLEGEQGILLVMEPVAGESLADLLEQTGPLDPEEVRPLGVALAEALEAVHHAGLVHRNLAAHHVILRPDGTPCLVGFGFARFADASLYGSTLIYGGAPSTVYQVGGTRGARPPRLLPPHPAPEVLAGQRADARSDLYALGWVLHQCLTGEAPVFSGSQERTRAEDPRKLRPDLPPDLCRAIQECLAQSPLKRPADATTLRGLLAPAAPAAMDDEAPPRPGLPRRPWRAGTLFGATLLLVVAGLFLSSLGQTPPGDDEVRPEQERSPGMEPMPPDPDVRIGDIDADEAVRERSLDSYAPRFARSYALLIGIGAAYTSTGHPSLRNPARDVQAVQDKLESMPWEGWEVTTVLEGEATRERILAELTTLSETCQPDDRILVYYAGHGMDHRVSDESAWILPADAGPVEGDGARSNWIRFSEFDGFLKETPAKHVMIALDCCHSGRIAATRAGLREFHARYLTEKAHVMLTSGGPDEKVSDGVGVLSPFADAFLRALERDTPALTSSRLYVEVQSRFEDQSIPQMPQLVRPLGEEGGGEFVFFLQDPNR